MLNVANCDKQFNKRVQSETIKNLVIIQSDYQFIFVTKEKGESIMAKKKTLLIVPVIFIITIIISMLTPMSALADDSNYECRLTAPSQSIGYYNTQLNVYAQTGTPMPNCVAYAYGRIYEMNGEKPLITHGNAGEWWFINKNHNYYPSGSEPKVGAVACWSNHVAIVEKVNENGSVTLSESHWGGSYFDTVTYYDMSSHYGQSFYGFIYAYNDGITQELRHKLLNAEAKAKVQNIEFSSAAPDASITLSLNKVDAPTNSIYLADMLQAK